MQLSTQLFDALTQEYRREVGDDEYRLELELLETMPQKFTEHAWSTGDLEDIVRWKSPRALPKFRENDEAEINDAVKQALEARSVKDRIEALRSLDGVEVPMASSFLLFVDPETYTVIDSRAWDALREFGYVSGDHDNTSIEQYLLYLGCCRTLAVEYEVDLRDLDRALWVIGGED